MQAGLVIAIVTSLGLGLSLGVLTTLYSQNAFAQNSTGSTNGGAVGGVTTQSGGGGGSGGATTGGGSTGQSGGGGGSSGNTIGTGTGHSVDRQLFCNTGMITPICK